MPWTLSTVDFRMVLIQKQKMKKEVPIQGNLYVTYAWSVQNKILNGLVLREAEELRKFVKEFR